MEENGISRNIALLSVLLSPLAASATPHHVTITVKRSAKHLIPHIFIYLPIFQKNNIASYFNIFLPMILSKINYNGNVNHHCKESENAGRVKRVIMMVDGTRIPIEDIRMIAVPVPSD